MQDFPDNRQDVWRAFATRPEKVSWMRLRRHLTAIPGATMVDLACDRMNEAALIITYRGHRFAIDLHDGRFRFSVQDPACPDEILRDVLVHADQLLAPTPSRDGHPAAFG
jgi:hypothetical protein